MSQGFSHISYTKLVDWIEGRLAPAQQAVVTAHLDACSRCRTEAARIERIVAAMHADNSQDAPPALIARAVQSFRGHVVAQSPSLVQRLVAALRFESASLTPALGMRGERASERQLVFVAGDCDVDLRISPSATGWQVSGQVLGAELGAGVAHLAGAKTECQAAIDPMSTFALPAAPSGHYTLTLSWPALAIAVDDLVLGDA